MTTNCVDTTMVARAHNVRPCALSDRSLGIDTSADYIDFVFLSCLCAELCYLLG